MLKLTVVLQRMTCGQGYVEDGVGACNEVNMKFLKFCAINEFTIGLTWTSIWLRRNIRQQSNHTCD